MKSRVSVNIGDEYMDLHARINLEQVLTRQNRVEDKKEEAEE